MTYSFIDLVTVYKRVENCVTQRNVNLNPILYTIFRNIGIHQPINVQLAADNTARRLVDLLAFVYSVAYSFAEGSQAVIFREQLLEGIWIDSA